MALHTSMSIQNIRIIGFIISGTYSFYRRANHNNCMDNYDGIHLNEMKSKILNMLSLMKLNSKNC